MEIPGDLGRRIVEAARLAVELHMQRSLEGRSSGSHSVDSRTFDLQSIDSRSVDSDSIDSDSIDSQLRDRQSLRRTSVPGGTGWMTDLGARGIGGADLADFENLGEAEAA
jgi:hypothetical protein